MTYIMIRIYYYILYFGGIDDESMMYSERQHCCEFILKFKITIKYINQNMYSLYYIDIKFTNDRGHLFQLIMKLFSE